MAMDRGPGHEDSHLLKSRSHDGEPLSFGSELRRLRQARGLSLNELSALLHYSKGYLGKVERGDKKATADMARRCDETLDARGALARLVAPVPRAGRPGIAPARPMQLPPATSDFVGRTSYLHQLDGLVPSGNGLSGPGTVVISGIDGAAGIGKTTLAVHWAHRVRDRFPDGSLYVNLRGFDSGPPLQPTEALGGFLLALGLQPKDIPTGVDEQAALFRSMLDGKRTLLLLDNAASSEQVRPLLPASARCLVLVTSRLHLSGLGVRDGARYLSLDFLAIDEAVALLRRVIGARRVDAERSAAHDLAWQCACLPLALRVVAERLTSRPYTSLTEVVGELTDQRERLDILAVTADPTADVRTVFSWSYHQLIPEAARMFRLLGLHVGVDISVAAAAALSGVPLRDSRRLLDLLTECHLLEQVTEDYYYFHDLLRCYAAERAEVEESAPDRDCAVERLLRWYLQSADAANRVVTPHHQPISDLVGCELIRVEFQPTTFRSSDHGLAWLESERLNLLAAIRKAASRQLHTVSWKIAVLLWGFFYLHKHWSDWMAASRIALASARHIGDREGEAWTLVELGGAYRDTEQFAGAVECYAQALPVLHAIGNGPGEGWTLTNLGRTHANLEQHGEAISCYRLALAIFKRVDHRWGEGWALDYLGLSYASQGRLDDAIGCYQQALAIFDELTDLEGQAECLTNLGTARRDLGDHQEAITYHGQALAVHRRTGYRWGEGWVLGYLGLSYASQGRLDDAIGCYQQAVAIFDEIGHPRSQAEFLANLGQALHDAHQPGPAQEHWRAALTIFEGLDDPRAGQVRARLGTLDNDDRHRAGPTT